MPTEKNLASLVINEVESTVVYEEMKRQGLLNDDELYLVTDSENNINIDQVPTAGSKNLVYSGGVYDALQQAGSADSVNEWNNGEKQRFWRGTKEEYEALAEKPEDTLFILTDDEGEAGAGGDMEAAVYDPQGKAQDIFKYVDDGLATKAPAGYELGGTINTDGADIPLNESGVRDFNKAINTGWYWIYDLGNEYVNAPPDEGGTDIAFMRVETYRYSLQTVYCTNTRGDTLALPRIWMRKSADRDYNTWGAWQCVSHTYGTTDLTAGSSPLFNGQLYFVYE